MGWETQGGTTSKSQGVSGHVLRVHCILGHIRYTSLFLHPIVNCSSGQLLPAGQHKLKPFWSRSSEDEVVLIVGIPSGTLCSHFHLRAAALPRPAMQPIFSRLSFQGSLSECWGLLSAEISLAHVRLMPPSVNWLLLNTLLKARRSSP